MEHVKKAAVKIVILIFVTGCAEPGIPKNPKHGPHPGRTSGPGSQLMNSMINTPRLEKKGNSTPKEKLSKLNHPKNAMKLRV